MNADKGQKARERIIRLLEQSLESHRGPDSDRIDDEEITLLATGQIDKIPQPRRNLLLHQVAIDPVAARLVKDIHGLRLDESAADTSSIWRSNKSLRTMTIAWTLAACLMAGLFLWRAVDPAPAPTMGISAVQPYGHTQEQPDYWVQLESKRLAQQAGYHRYREYALLATAITCLVLSVGLVSCVISCRRQPQATDNSA